MVSAERERFREKKNFRGKKKVKTRIDGRKKKGDSFLTSADSALVVGCSLVRRGCRAARVHRFVSPFAHLSFFLFFMKRFSFFWKSRDHERERKTLNPTMRSILTHLVNYILRQRLKTHTHTHIYKIFSLIDESETQKRAVVDGSVHGGTIGGVRAREGVSFDV